jgi:hypothetical protein
MSTLEGGMPNSFTASCAAFLQSRSRCSYNLIPTTPKSSLLPRRQRKEENNRRKEMKGRNKADRKDRRQCSMHGEKERRKREVKGRDERERRKGETKGRDERGDERRDERESAEKEEGEKGKDIHYQVVSYLG